MANHNPNPDPTGPRQQEVSALLHYGNARMFLLGDLQGSDAPCGLANKAERLEHKERNAACHRKEYSMTAGVVGIRGSVVWRGG